MSMDDLPKRNWSIYKGDGLPHDGIQRLPDPPKWRQFRGEIIEERILETQDSQLERRFGNLGRGKTFQASDDEINLINVALYLRRPLLVTGDPGTGKSSLAYGVAHELKLGKVLRWSITSRSTLQEGLYQYDAIGRLQEASLRKENGSAIKAHPAPDIGEFIRLGPLGTALLPSKYPRVLLIDEIDKSNIDLPNDLLHIFEEGEFTIPELARLSNEQEVKIFPYDGQDRVAVRRGQIMCHAFPFVVMTSNGEREFPAPFLRRCQRLEVKNPSDKKLANIIDVHFDGVESKDELIAEFLDRRKDKGDLATDQLLNAIYLTQNLNMDLKDKNDLINAVYKPLRSS